MPVFFQPSPWSFLPTIVLTTALGYSCGMHKLFSAPAIASILTLSLSFALFFSVAHAEIYKQINPDGSVTFTDVPSSKDEKPLPLKPMSTFKATPAPAISSTQQSTPASKKYTNVSITSPANEATIRDNAGNLTVMATVTPGLQSGHKMVLLDNGATRAESTSGSFKLSNIDRGAHTLTVQVQNRSGKTLLSSKPVTVYLHRHSALR